MGNMGYTALYRQYRPLTFDQVAGQQHITTTLRNQVTGDRVAHAYLFAGTRGTGKTSTARILARAVNCADRKDGNPCNRCKTCSRALEGKLMDIIEIDAASNRGVDEIRDLREKVKYPPAEGRYRVYIVDEVHMLTAEAFNALLKTLEEPPSHVIFILATTEPQKLPATVLSRCQRFDFKRIPFPEMVKLLEQVSGEAGIDIDQRALELIAGRADGAARDALGLLDKCFAFEQGNLTLDRVVSVLGMAQDRLLFDLARRLSKRDAAGCIMLLDQAARDGRDTGQLFKDIIYHLRDILITKVAPSGLADLSDKKKEALKALASDWEVNTLIRAINVMAEAEGKAKWSTYPEVFLEVALVKLCEPSMDASLEGIMDRLSRLEDVVLKGGTVKTSTGTEDKAPAGGDLLPAAADNSAIPPEEGAGKPDKSRDNETVSKVSPRQNKESDAGHEKEKDKTLGNDGGRGDGQERDESEEREDLQRDGHRLGPGNVSLELMVAAWGDVLKYLEKHKKGLYTVLMGSRPIQVNEEGMLVVGCKALYGICYEIANSKENRDALRDAVYSVTKAHFDIKIESIDDQGEAVCQSLQEDRSLYEEAVSIFGGDLVERLDD